MDIVLQPLAGVGWLAHFAQHLPLISRPAVQFSNHHGYAQLPIWIPIIEAVAVVEVEGRAESSLLVFISSTHLLAPLIAK